MLIIFFSVDLTYGMPSRSIYDWNVESIVFLPHHSPFTDIEHRLKIEKFSDKMTRSLYSNSSDPSGTIAHDHLPAVLSNLNADLEELNALSAVFSSKLQPHNFESVTTASKFQYIQITNLLLKSCQQTIVARCQSPLRCLRVLHTQLLPSPRLLNCRCLQRSHHLHTR